jgi:U32 family peptidase
MKLVTYAQSLHDLNLIKEQGLGEVILGHRDFNRFGKLDDSDFFTIAKRAGELGLRVIFEWDILMTQGQFKILSAKIKNYLDPCDVLRVQDPGALEWGLRETQLPLQFIAENGNHNLLGLQSWIDYAQGRMERIILSIELSKTVLEDYLRKLTIPCELLGFGRILLFYTPRGLLSPLAPEKFSQNEELAVLGESEESPHKGFPIVENRHGTFMFHIKEFCVLDFAQELEGFGLHSLRVDLRWEGMTHLKTISDLVKNFTHEAFSSFKSSYPQDLMRGFYLVNKTDVLFPKLKNHRLQQREGDYLGEVLEAEKSSHLAVMVKNAAGLKLGQHLRVVHPTGKELHIEVKWLKNLAMEDVDHIVAHRLALIPFAHGVWVKSHLFLRN